MDNTSVKCSKCGNIVSVSFEYKVNKWDGECEECKKTLIEKRNDKNRTVYTV